ncbi:UNVERIFIED_CONTAM: hypothetical protein FKN15_006301 [Acipenser sinensis]
MAVALEDFYPSDCRFIPIRKGQVIYVFSKLKGRGRLFWAGSVQSGYYSEQEARLGFFPSSVVEETQLLQPGDVEVMTEVSAAFLHPMCLKSLQNLHTHTVISVTDDVVFVCWEAPLFNRNTVLFLPALGLLLQLKPAEQRKPSTELPDCPVTAASHIS